VAAAENRAEAFLRVEEGLSEISEGGRGAFKDTYWELQVHICGGCRQS
jgi:hypothetical protein